jgi:hypothetical protein
LHFFNFGYDSSHIRSAFNEDFVESSNFGYGKKFHRTVSVRFLITNREEIKFIATAIMVLASP